MKPVYKKTKNSLFHISYHLVMVTRYRMKVLVDDLKRDLTDQIYEICRSYDWEVLALSIRPDHCYIHVKCTPEHSPVDVLAKIRRPTSAEIRKKYPRVAHLTSLWTREFLVSTHPEITEEEIEAFLRIQKKHG